MRQWNRHLALVGLYVGQQYLVELNGIKNTLIYIKNETFK